MPVQTSITSSRQTVNDGSSFAASSGGHWSSTRLELTGGFIGSGGTTIVQSPKQYRHHYHVLSAPVSRNTETSTSKTHRNVNKKPIAPYAPVHFSVYDKLLESENRHRVVSSSSQSSTNNNSAHRAPSPTAVRKTSASSGPQRRPSNGRRQSPTPQRQPSPARLSLPTKELQFATEKLAEMRHRHLEEKKSLLLITEQVTSMFSAARANASSHGGADTGSGFGGKMTQQDVSKLLRQFSLSYSEEDCDDFWFELHQQQAHHRAGEDDVAVRRKGGHIITNVTAVVAALLARDARPLASRSQSVSGTVATSQATLMRLTSPTASSSRRLAPPPPSAAAAAPTTVGGDNAAKKPPQRCPSPSTTTTRTKSPSIYDRLCKTRRGLTEEEHLAAIERKEAAAEHFTFNPTISKVAHTKEARFLEPTKSSIERKKAPASKSAETGDGGAVDNDYSPARDTNGADDENTHDLRSNATPGAAAGGGGSRAGSVNNNDEILRSKPAVLPTAIPSGYIESVARLRKAAASKRLQQHREVDYGYWRYQPSSQEMAKEEDELFGDKPILRLPLHASAVNVAPGGESTGVRSTATDAGVIDIRLAHTTTTTSTRGGGVPSSRGGGSASVSPHRRVHTAATSSSKSPFRHPAEPEPNNHIFKHVSTKQLAAQFCSSKGIKHSDPSRGLIEEAVQHVLRKQQQSAH